MSLPKEPRLVCAVAKGDLDATKKLLAEGESPSTLGFVGFSALHYAVSLDSSHTPEKRESMLECARLLIDAGASVRHSDDQGRTALHVAVLRINPDAVQALVAAGANPLETSTNYGSPVNLAVRMRTANPASRETAVVAAMLLLATAYARRRAALVACYRLAWGWE